MKAFRYARKMPSPRQLLLVQVDGMGSVDEVTARILAAVDA